MGDALAITALGIEACKGLVIAVSRFSSFPGDVKTAIIQTQDLTGVLFALKGILEGADSESPRYAAVRKCLLNCADGVVKLNEKVRTLQGSYSGASNKSSSRQTAQRMIHVFSKPHFDDLRNSVEELHQRLSTSIQVYELGTVTDLASEIRRSSQYNKREFEDLASEIAKVASSIQDQEALLTSSFTNLRSGIKRDIELEISKLGSLVKYNLNGSTSSPGDLAEANSLIPYSHEHQTSLSKHIGTMPPGYQADLLDQTYLSRKFKRAKRNEESDRPDSTADFKWTVSLFSRSLTFSFAATFGAGGSSIGPNLTLKGCVVNKLQSPAFGLISNTRHSLCGSSGRSKNISQVLRGCIRDLEGIFQQGESAPTDVTVKEYRSIAHEALYIMHITFFNERCGNTIENRVAWVTFVRSLIELGVPMNELDYEGKTPWGLVISHSGMEPVASLALESQLIDLGLENKFLHETFNFNRDSRSPYGERYITFPQSHGLLYDESVAEEYGCGSIALAVVSGDLARLQSTIRYRSRISEDVNEVITPWHITALHIACLKNSIEAVKCLLHAGADLYAPGAIVPATEYALRSSSLDIVRMLFPEDGQWITDDGVHELDFANIQRNPDQRIVPYLIEQLADRRRELASIAARILTSDERQKLLPPMDSTDVLDYHALTVYQTVSSRASIPSRLIPAAHGSVYSSRAIYAENAELLWKAGFRDIDLPRYFPGEHGAVVVGLPYPELKSPLLREASNPWFTSSSMSSICLSQWLCSKGARLDQLTSRPGERAIHILARSLGRHRAYQPESPIILKLMEYLISRDDREYLFLLKDNDRCACAPSGSSFVVHFLRKICEVRYTTTEKRVDDAITLAICLLEYFDASSEPGRTLLLEALRFITFTSLCISHTCYIYIHDSTVGCVAQGCPGYDMRVDKLEQLVKVAEERLENYPGSSVDFLKAFLDDFREEIEASSRVGNDDRVTEVIEEDEGQKEEKEEEEEEEEEEEGEAGHHILQSQPLLPFYPW